MKREWWQKTILNQWSREETVIGKHMHFRTPKAFVIRVQNSLELFVAIGEGQRKPNL